MRDLTISELMCASDILLDEGCFVEYITTEPERYDRVISSGVNLEAVILKKDLYEQLGKDARWFLRLITLEHVPIKTLLDLMAYLRGRGWSRRRIRRMLSSLSLFLRQLREV